MPNPSGPYPGRQLFLGLTVAQEPCLVYLVTGRSPESRQRKAIAIDNTVRIGPLGSISYDPLRHYTAVKYDDGCGTAAVSNGIQTEAMFETYKLLLNVGTPPTTDFMEKLMDGADAEPDSLHTPRIAGVVVINGGNPVFIIGIKTHLRPVVAHQLAPSAGSLGGISVYRGNLDSPEPTDPKSRPSQIKFAGKSAHDLAEHLYDMSVATYKGEDIRVCSVGGVYASGSWDIAIVNKY